MGHLTKSKGRVTEADIHVANVLMDRMNLHGASRTAAQQAFRDGKADNYPLRENASAAQRLLWPFRSDSDVSGNSAAGGVR